MSAEYEQALQGLDSNDKIRAIRDMLAMQESQTNQYDSSESDDGHLQLDEQHRLSNGNIAAFTCLQAQLQISSGNKNRYINPKIEQELVDFKQEIEEKFHDSETNKYYKFKRVEPGNSKNRQELASLMRQTNKMPKKLGDSAQDSSPEVPLSDA